ncbi:hypothetical protein [uncultured Nostoc sp.]|nr:hypothetical protein [uncultured Nostoc sp.]
MALPYPYEKSICIRVFVNWYKLLARVLTTFSQYFRNFSAIAAKIKVPML